MRELGIILWMLAAPSLWAQNTVVQKGDVAPEISLPAPDEKIIALSELQGKLVLVDFWATWCAPCVAEQPLLKELYEEYGSGEGKFEILGVSLDRKKENWVNGIARLGITWPQVSDLQFWKSPVAEDYGITELPFNVLVGESGKIVAVNLHGTELEDFIRKYLQDTE